MQGLIKHLMAAGIASGLSISAVAGSAAEVLDQALQANERAKSLGFEWTVTGEAIKAAKAAIESGDDSLALAERALFLAQASADQGGREGALWEQRFPK